MFAQTSGAGTGVRAACLVALLGLLACEPTPVIDAGPTSGPDVGRDAAPSCALDEDCEDGLACNGQARCAEGRCVAGEPLDCDDGIACTADSCSEELRRCVNRPLDADGDGAIASTCLDARGMPLGDDCDDANAAILPGAMELCDAAGVDEDCDPSTLGVRDGDGDGYIDAACCNGEACGEDCNDAVRGANPAGTEVCNGIDDDCDGDVDEDVRVTVFRDVDGDGRGDPMAPRLACSVTPGFSVFDDDCDDTTALRSPALPEACDMIDNDCDGTPDPEDAPTIVRWFEDADGDGFGDPAVSVDACARPEGAHSLLGTDCDDGNPAVSPGQAELCNGQDDDCNGAADFSLAPGDLEDDDLDGVADARCSPSPLEPDCDDRDATSRGDAPEICDGRDNDCDSMTDEGVMVTAFYRDADGDGHGSETSGVSLGCGAIAGYVTSNDDCDDTSDTRNPDVLEGCNSRDDDCDGRVDEDPTSSICPADMGIPQACVAGRCRLGSAECPLGRADCDRLSGNGCEAVLASDASNCGACGRRCAVEAGASSVCASARCTPISCDGAFLDCNGDLGRGGDGCEVDGASDESHCGGCTLACPALPHVTVTSCLGGVCGFDPARDCDAGWLDCNGVTSDGCEAQLGTDTFCSSCTDACAVTEECDGTRTCRTRICPGTTSDCDSNGSCETDLSSTLTSCGACGTTCSGRAADWACTAGDCTVLRCIGSALDCDGLDATGCEIDGSSDIAHCGGCGRACTGGNALWACASSACAVTGCLGGARDCDASSANGCEVSIDTDPLNCGACGRACPREPGTVAPACSAGACAAPRCASGRLDCDFDLGTGGNGCEATGFICTSLSPSPTSRNFGAVIAGTSGAPVTFTVRNVGDGVSGRLMVSMDGAHPGDFLLSMDGCTGRTLTAGATCDVRVTFAPTSTSTRTATLRVTATPVGLAEVPLSGVGLISTMPATHDFGARTNGLTSAPVSFTIRNPGTVGAGTLSVSLVGTNPGDFALASDPCSGTTLAAGATCTVTATFTPTAAGARTATLRAVASLGGTANTTLSGTGSAPITVSPSTFAYGTFTVGASSATQTFTVSNPGTLVTGALAVSLTGTHAADYTITANTCAGAMLAAGTGNCTVTVRLTPSAAGARSATLQITGAPGGTVTAALSGSGSLPLSSAPASHAFGTRTLGQPTVAQRFDITNPGTIPTGMLMALLTGTHPGDYALTANACSGTTLPPGGSCSVDVVFTATAVGARTATLRVTGAPGGTVDVGLSGTGSAAITAAPTSLAFGAVTLGAMSLPQTVTISNPGTVTTGSLGVSLVGTHPGDFTLMGGTCMGANVSPGGNCSVIVRFRPTAAGSRSATVRVTGVPGGTVDIPASGTGDAPITISPTTPSFGTVTVGQSSGNISLVVSNPGATASDLTVSLGGTNPADFMIVSDGCNGTLLAPAGSCTIVARFIPLASGARAATLSVLGSPGGMAAATLTGTGSAPITLSGSLAFQPVAVGSASGNLVVTVTNNGTVATGALTPSFTGGVAAEMGIGTASCTPLAPGASCTYFVTFQPTSVGTRTGSLVVSATPGGSASLSISATGIQLSTAAGDYSEPFIGAGSIVSLDCPPGQAMVGVFGFSGLLIDGLGPLCAPVGLSTDSSAAMYTHPIVTTGAATPGAFAGGAGGGSFSDVCPPNHLVTAISGGIGDDLDRIQLTCQIVSAVHLGGSSYNFTYTDTQFTPARGGGGGGPYTQSCTSGPAFFFGLRADNITYVSGIGSQCRRVAIIDR